MATLELERITVRYGAGEPVLDAVDLAVEDGEFLVLVGPSGCGKSTLLRVVAGLVPPTSGDVRIDGASVTGTDPGSRDVAMVFQNYALYPHMTVAGNLAFPLRMRRTPRSEVRRCVEEVAERLGLGELLHRRPAQLSGGQMQRVALGRALVRSPRVFLFDEPLSNLDARLRAELRAELRRLHEELGTTSLYVTHDQAEAMSLGRRVCVLEGGRVQQLAPPQVVHDRPATTFVADFVGAPPMNLLRGRADGGRFRAGALSAPCPVGDGELVLGVRPAAVRIERAERADDAGGGGLGAVLDLEPEGDRAAVRVALGEATSVLALVPNPAPAVGDEVRVRFDDGSTHWFDSSGARIEEDR